MKVTLICLKIHLLLKYINNKQEIVQICKISNWKVINNHKTNQLWIAVVHHNKIIHLFNHQVGIKLRRLLNLMIIQIIIHLKQNYREWKQNCLDFKRLQIMMMMNMSMIGMMMNNQIKRKKLHRNQVNQH